LEPRPREQEFPSECQPDDAQLTAPFDGVVSAGYVSEGSLVGPNRAVLRLLSRGDAEVRFAILEENARAVPARR
jgi:multidrug efflux pump subunit AcrA (membrane-fusion protein)